MSETTISAFQRRLLAWYDAHKRTLPWRDEPDPYKVWISEIMLQQTQVERVKDFYARFLAAFPTLPDLAAAPWEQVLEAWRGLGYYNRARNLQKAAQTVVAQHGGRFPDTLDAVRALPGIGPYTAGAIVSMAFGRDEAALDANIRRVLQRHFGTHPLEDAAKDQVWWEWARDLLPQGRAGDWNQALMDLGATVCTARKPLCSECPAQESCRYRRYLDAGNPPYVLRKPPRAKVPAGALEVAAALIHEKGRFLAARRPEGKPMAGWWEFPGGKRQEKEDWRACLKREIAEELGVEVAVGLEYDRVVFSYPDKTVALRFFRCTILSGKVSPQEGQEVRWVTAMEMAEMPFLEADRPVIERLARGSGV